ncbi:MAG: helix-turn-helix transcriptional regulator [Muribaculaceae bacterium]|nr:helix-turn-helix transcriptional regulator [Muribaculaceae bacterium]
MYDPILWHARTVLYGVAVGFFLNLIITLAEASRNNERDHARFAFRCSMAGCGWFIAQFIAWFLVDSHMWLYPKPIYPWLPGFLKFMEMIVCPFWGLSLLGVTSLKRRTVGYVNRIVTPLVAVWLLYPLLYPFTGDLPVTLGYIYVTACMAYFVIKIELDVHRYSDMLNRTYANTSQRGVRWVKTLLYTVIITYVSWIVTGYLFHSSLVDCIFICFIMSSGGYFVYRLTLQNFNIEVMADIEASGEYDQIIEVEKETETRAAIVTVDVPDVTGNAPATKLKAWLEPRFDEAVRTFCNKQENFTNPELTIQDVATAVGTNRTYVSHWCKHNGFDFSSYITGIRLDYAEKLMAKPGMTINEVSETVGFNNVRIFRQAFVARFGCSPSDYRSRLASGDSKQ